MIVLRIPGKPTGKGRPRFNTKTRRSFTPAKTVNAEEHIRAIWREAGEPRIEGRPPIAISIRIVVTRPQSHFRKNGMLNTEGGRHPYPDNKKPDLDNAAKLVMDALNGRAYQDDVQVVNLKVIREWGQWPETVVRIQDHTPEALSLDVLTPAEIGVTEGSRLAVVGR